MEVLLCEECIYLRMHSVQVPVTSTIPISATVVQYKMYRHNTGLMRCWTISSRWRVLAASDQCRWQIIV